MLLPLRTHAVPFAIALAVIPACADPLSAHAPPVDKAAAADTVQTSAGSIVITEIMVNPSQPQGASKRKYAWFEIYNASPKAIDLTGWQLTTAKSKAPHAIAGPLVLPAAGYAILAAADGAEVNDGIAVDYVYGKSISIAAAGDVLTIADPLGVVVDRVDFRPGAGEFQADYAKGVSMNLSADALDAKSNDSASAWCQSTHTFLPPMPGASVTTIGSPRLANEVCLGARSNEAAGGAAGHAQHGLAGAGGQATQAAGASSSNAAGQGGTAGMGDGRLDAEGGSAPQQHTDGGAGETTAPTAGRSHVLADDPPAIGNASKGCGVATTRTGAAGLAWWLTCVAMAAVAARRRQTT